MFVGHASLALALAVGVARVRGWPRRRALAAGVVAGLFATVPDADMAYALVGLSRGLLGGADGVFAVTEQFWAASTATHRGATHSLVVAVPAAVAFAVGGRRGALLVGALVAATAVLGGWLAAAVVALFGSAGLAVGRLGAAADLQRSTVLGAALLGLLTHPFGDFFTGEPPALLWPLGGPPVGARVAPFADPTLNLLLAFGVELAALWAGVAALSRLSGRAVVTQVDRRASVGAAYAGAAVVLTPPTMAVSYHFVLSVLATGLLGAVPIPGPVRNRLLGPRTSRGGLLAAAATALAATTVAGVAYTVVYLLLAAP